jgi:hypothetical protein
VGDEVTTYTFADGDRADGAHEVPTSNLADGADAPPDGDNAADAADADAGIRTSSSEDADPAHAAADTVDDEVPKSRLADEADGELIDENTTQVGTVLKEGRRIPVYHRPSRSRKQHKLVDLGPPQDLPQADLYETDRRYDGDAGRICEAAITEGLEQIERSPPSAP